jgi:hypothetical protein
MIGERGQSSTIPAARKGRRADIVRLSKLYTEGKMPRISQLVGHVI